MKGHWYEAKDYSASYKHNLRPLKYQSRFCQTHNFLKAKLVFACHFGTNFEEFQQEGRMKGPLAIDSTDKFVIIRD